MDGQLPTEAEVAEAVAEASGGTVGTLTSRAQKIARAVLALIPPQRCVPSEDGLANVLRDILVRVFEQDKDIVAQDAARAVLDLFAAQPTVAQVKAEALRDAAAELDLDATQGRVRLLDQIETDSKPAPRA